MIKALTVAAVMIAATPAMACSIPSHFGGLEEQLYDQCRAQERAAEAQEENNRLLQQQIETNACNSYRQRRANGQLMMLETIPWGCY